MIEKSKLFALFYLEQKLKHNPKKTIREIKKVLLKSSAQMSQDQQENQSQNSSSSIKVFIRVRPLTNTQKDTKQIVEIQSDSKTLKIYNNQIDHIESKFDKVFGKQSEQQQVFDNFQPYVKKLFQGSNLTIFAYGQTGSGKTYTMFGNDWQSFVDDIINSRKSSLYVNGIDQNMQKAGVIPRSINSVFKEYQQYKERFQLFCSFLQIYNEKIYDLLQDSPTPKALNIHQSKVNGIFVEGLTEFQVENLGDCLKLMRQGQKNRFVRETTMNAKSSRSHTIFQILVQATTSDSQGNYAKARLNLCDLAGSQKIQKGQNLKNDHLQELKNINLSLTTLGKVINSLSSGKKATVAAFRESKLTRLLQQSLTVNTNTFIIGNISPSSKNIDQTINTLKFTQRASHITMKVKPIEFNEMNPDSVSKLKKQIQYLKNLLDSKKQGVNYDSENLQFNDQNIIKNETKDKETLSQQQFEKLLIENRKMKKEIYELQNNLQKIKNETSQMNSSRSRQNSAISAQNSPQSEISSNNSLRRQFYHQKFFKKGNDSQSKRQSRNRSIFVSAGKSTINNDKMDNNLVKMRSQQNKQQKLQILRRFEQMQNAKILSEKFILQQLDSIKNHNHGGDNKQIFQNNSKQNGSMNRNYQANVFRRGKMSLELGLVENINGKQKSQYKLSERRKKVDYKDKIKQLQNRLYNK